MKKIFERFVDEEKAQRAISQLNRHNFVGKDTVRVFDEEKITAEDNLFTNGDKPNLKDALAKLGVVEQQLPAYIETLQNGGCVVAVQTDEERVTEAAKILQQAQA